MVLTISELIYIYNSKPEYSVNAKLFIAYVLSNINNPKSVKYLQLAGVEMTEINSVESKGKFPKLEPSNLNEFSNLNSINYSSIKGKEFIVIFPANPSEKSLMFYNLALNAYGQGAVDLALNYFTIASYIKPHSSYYHVELANLYLILGNPKRSTEVIEYCKSYEIPKKHCEEYQTNNLKTNTPLEVGFLSGVIVLS